MGAGPGKGTKKTAAPPRPRDAEGKGKEKTRPALFLRLGENHKKVWRARTVIPLSGGGDKLRT